MVIAAALAPNLHYGLALALSPRAAQLSIWSAVGFYLLFVVVARRWQITNKASMIVLIVAMLLVAATLALDRQVKQWIATSIGFYADAPPWVDEKPQTATRSLSQHGCRLHVGNPRVVGAAARAGRRHA